MLKHYLMIFLISMVPLIELRGAIPVAMTMDLQYIPAMVVCCVGNMLPVPIIYLFARQVLVWGSDKPCIGTFFRFCLDKGERGGRKLVAKTGRGGLFVALMLFVGIPIPGTGAWTGTLAASFINMGLKSTVASVSLGLVLAAVIMSVGSSAALSVIGL